MPNLFSQMAAKAFVLQQTVWLRDCRLVFHIGLHKTGTTYLQHQISVNRTDLMEQGLLFPATGLGMGCLSGPRGGKMAGHGDFGRFFVSQDWPKAALLLSLLAREARSAECRNILISVENVSYVRQPDRSALGRFLLGRFGRADILIYLRRWDRWIESLYKERVGGGETRDFQTFLTEERWLLDFPARLAAWEAVCDGNIRLRVFDYDEVRQNGGLLPRFFEDAFPGIAAPVERRNLSSNPSPNAAQTEVMRRFNLEHGTAPGRQGARAALTETEAFRSLEGPEGFFPVDERVAFLETFAAQNAVLTTRYGIDLLPEAHPG